MTAGTNKFLPFATGGSPNVVDDATFAALAALPTGFQSGVAASNQLNKVWRQSSVIAAAVGQLIANTGANASDSDSIATLVANIRTALTGNVATQSAVSSATTLTAAQAGALIQMQSGAGVYAVTLPAANAVVSGACYHFFNINNTYTHTVQRGGTDTIYVNGSTVNSLSVSPGATLILASNGSNAWVPVGGSAHLPYSATWQKAVFPNTIGVGGATPANSGVGITFPASQSASSDANTLDDYEEGTWAPTLARSSTGVSPTYTVQSGRYVKIGSLVTLTATITISASSAGSGYNFVGGLPFSVNPSGLDVRHCGSVMYNSIFGTNSALRCGVNSSGQIFFMTGSRGEVEMNEAYVNGVGTLQLTITHMSS